MGANAEKPLLETGMLALKEESGKIYDRFRDRIMFPIEDRRGKIIAFGGRAIGDDLPKYLNSPETQLFHKSRELYGLSQALAGNRTPKYLLVVEGYMDVVALAQHGIPQVVAILGSALNVQHLEKLFQVTQRLIFCFDGDDAGLRAAWRAVPLVLPALREQREVRFLTLPASDDPDTLIRSEGRAGFFARMTQSVPVIEYLLERIRAQVTTARTDRKARIIELIRPFWAQLPSGVYRTVLSEELAHLARIPPEQLTKLMDANLPARSKDIAPHKYK